jgi:ABC-type multidrug transport system fused ATPase/permease subunit
MAKNLSNSSTNIKPLNQKFNFWTLFRKFKFKVVRHFISSTILTLIGVILLRVITEIFQLKGKPDNWTNVLLSENIQNFLGLKDAKISEGKFIIIGLLLVSICALIYYWDSLWEQELSVRGEHYAKNILLEKYRRLPFEEQQKRKNEINNLVERDSWEIGDLWEHLPNHIFHSVLEIIFLILVNWDDLKKMTTQQRLFSLFWLGLINVIVYYFTRFILNNERRYKKKLDEEWGVINKERNNVALIESMGLSSEYQQKQKNITQENEQLVLNYNRTKSLNKTIPNNFLNRFFPFILLALSRDFKGTVMIIFWRIFEDFSGIFKCLWKYADYGISQERISDFLLLDEKNDNLDQNKLSNDVLIAAIRMENVSFRYKGQTEWVLKNYSRVFTPENLNRMIGKNGTGKSTILYLLLGMITPEKGQIIIEDEKGRQYDLNKEVNLKHWRENNIAYCAHETLIEEGSTGQKQLANIDNIISTKQSSRIFLFDEADNALDQENQEKIQEKIKNLVNKKIVIYIKH